MCRLSIGASLVVLVLLTVHVHSSSAAKWKCGQEGEREADELVSKILTIGRDDINFPTNQSQLKVYCG